MRQYKVEIKTPADTVIDTAVTDDALKASEYMESKLADLPEEAVVGVKKGNYGAEALVRRELVSPSFPLERTTLEEIILFLAKGGR